MIRLVCSRRMKAVASALAASMGKPQLVLPQFKPMHTSLANMSKKVPLKFSSFPVRMMASGSNYLKITI